MRPGPEGLQPGALRTDARIGVVDGAQMLEPWYTRQSTFVGEAMLQSSDSALVTYTIPVYQVGTRFRDMVRGMIVRDGDSISNTYMVDHPSQGEHTEGHLKTIRLFAGYQGIGTIMESVEGGRLAKFRFVNFKDATGPGDIVSSRATIVDEQADSLILDPVEVRNQRGGRHTYMRRAVFVPERPITEPESMLARHAYFEIMAQFAGVAYAAMRGALPEGKNPIYVGLGATEITGEVVRAGDTLTGHVQAVEMMGEDFAEFSVVLRAGERDIVPKSKVRMGFVNKEDIERALQEQLNS